MDVVTLGQYQRPTRRHMAVAEYVTPEAFQAYQKVGAAGRRVPDRCQGHGRTTKPGSRPCAIASGRSPLQALHTDRPCPVAQVAEELGFLYAASGPMVRSSYRAGELYLKNMIRRQQEQEAAAAAAAGSAV